MVTAQNHCHPFLGLREKEQRKELRSLRKESPTRPRFRPLRRVCVCPRKVLLGAVVKKKLAGGHSPWKRRATPGLKPPRPLALIYFCFVEKPNTGESPLFLPEPCILPAPTVGRTWHEPAGTGEMQCAESSSVRQNRATKNWFGAGRQK